MTWVVLAIIIVALIFVFAGRHKRDVERRKYRDIEAKRRLYRR